MSEKVEYLHVKLQGTGKKGIENATTLIELCRFLAAGRKEEVNYTLIV